MKKFILLLSLLFCTLFCARAQSDTIWDYRSICPGNSATWTISIALASDTDTCIFSHNNIFDTIIGRTLILTPNYTTIYVLESINNKPPYNSKTYACKVTIKPVQTFTITQDSIHHVTCPGGSNGCFSVKLDSATQNYEWIKVSSESSFFTTQIYHNNFTSNNLSGGTYKIISHGFNGCEYRDSITIKSPPEWKYNFEESTFDTIKCNNPSQIHISFNGGTPPYSYEWHYDKNWNIPFPDSNTINIDFPGRYWCWIYDSRNCLFLDVPAFVDIYEILIDTISLLGPETACYGEPIALTAWSHGHGDYIWSTGDSTMDITTTIPESSWISVHFTDQNGCETEDSLYIQVDHPQVYLSETPDFICTNSVPIDFCNFIIGVEPPNGVLYFNGNEISSDGIISHLTEGPHSAILTYVDENNCFSQDTIVFTGIEPEEINLNIPSTMYVDSVYTLDIPYIGGTLYIDDTEIPYTQDGYIIHSNQFNIGSHNLHYEVQLGIYGCISEFEAYLEIRDHVGIDDINMYNIKAYPIPTEDILTLELENQFSSIQILDVTGKIQIQTTPLGQKSSIDVSSLSSGLYFVRLVSPNGSFTMKFVKK